MQVGAKVHEQESIISALAKKPQHKRLMPQYGTLYPASALPAKHEISAPQSQQILV